MTSNPKPFNSGYLEEKDNHRVYYAQYGHPEGEAIVSLHGGPGSRSKPEHASRYDLSQYLVVIFDQRGCGQSLSPGEITSNTTLDLVDDIERLRTALKIKHWYVAGGSWGSTLALAYSESYPSMVKGLLLSSIFLARRADEEWSFSEDQGIVKVFPDLWEKRREFFQKYQVKPPTAAKLLLAKIQSGNQRAINEIVAGVMNWEGNLMTAQADLHYTDPEDVTEENIASVRIFLHYEANNFFLAENDLIKNIGKIKHLPAIIVHGRYDLLCPVDQAWELQKNLSRAETVILPTSNHRFTADGEVARKFAFNYFLSRQIK